MSDTNGKIKFHKNPDRSKMAAYKPYVPQYQVHGKEPQEYHGGAVVPGVQFARPTALPSDNPRAKKPAIRQPYAEPVTSPLGRGRGLIPNVGNNIEHTWSGVDGDIVDDLSGSDIDPNHTMIDNNDYVSPEVKKIMGYQEAFEYQSGPTASDIQSAPSYGKVTFEDQMSQTKQQSSDDLLSIVNDLVEDSYLLIVTGVSVCSGPMEEIQDQARALVFGEHEMCDGNPIPIDDIIILKRVKVKVGLFLE